MNDFDTTLCVLAERTKDGVEYKCDLSVALAEKPTERESLMRYSAPSAPHPARVSLQGTMLPTDCATHCVRDTDGGCALLVAAIARAVRDAVPDSRLLCLLAWPAAHSRIDTTDEHGASLSDRVMREVVQCVTRDRPRRAARRQWQDDATRAVPDVGSSRVTDLVNNTTFDRCMAFAHDDASSLMCADLSSADAATLHALRDLTLVQWCSTSRNTVVTLVASVLFSTAELAALQLATSRHVFVCVDDSITAGEVRATVAEWGVVRRWVTECVPPHRAPTAAAATTYVSGVTAPTQAAPARLHDAVSSSVDDAQDDEEDVAQADALSSSSCRPVLSASPSERGLVRSLRVTQQQAHAHELRALRRELDRLRAEKASAVAERAACQQLLNAVSPAHTAAPGPLVLSGQGGLMGGEANAELVRLRDELRAALKSKRFLEEKARLLEFRDALSRTMAAASPGQPRGVAYDAHVVAQLQDELEQTRAAGARDVAVWRERVAASQQALLAATQELAALRAESAEVNKMLELQARVIAEAKRAMLSRRVTRDDL